MFTFNQFGHSVHSTFEQLRETCKYGQSETEDTDVVSVVDSILRLFFFLIIETFCLVCALVPLLQFTAMFSCFVVNSLCDVLETKCLFKAGLKLLTFVLQTAILVLFMSLCVKYSFGVMIGFVGKTLVNFVDLFKLFGM